MQLLSLNVQICNDIHLKTGKFNSNFQNQEKQGKKGFDGNLPISLQYSYEYTHAL